MPRGRFDQLVGKGLTASSSAASARTSSWPTFRRSHGHSEVAK
jgi:hypothetical protein